MFTYAIASPECGIARKPLHDVPWSKVMVLAPPITSAANGRTNVMSGPCGGKEHEHHDGGVYDPPTTPLRYTLRTLAAHSTPTKKLMEADPTVDPAGETSVKVKPIAQPPHE